MKLSKTALRVSSYYLKSFSIIYLAIFALFTFISLSVTVEAQLICPEEQITNTEVGFSESPSISADGLLLAFDSDADIIGINVGGESQIYLYDITSGLFTAITAEDSGDSRNPSTNVDGSRIAFSSNANINGGNPDGSNEIYLANTTNGVITQITNTPGGDNSLAPSISADGTQIAFESDANINGGNPDGSREIWLFDTGSGTFTQITNTVGDFSAGASISDDGTLVAFRSNANFNGGNPGGTSQVWLYSTITTLITQQTNTGPQESNGASISGDGTIIAFTSRANINGGNPEGNIELYYVIVATGMIIQVTDEVTGTSGGAAIDRDGSFIAFNSRANINGNNPEENTEIYVFNVNTGVTTQVTDQISGESFNTTINAEGNLIGFSSDAFGNPVDNFEIFLSSCFDRGSQMVPTLSEWGMIAMAGILGLVGFMVMRRKRAVA